MGHTANIVNFPGSRRSEAEGKWRPAVSPFARLVPGISSESATEITDTATADNGRTFPSPGKRHWLNEALAELTPKYFQGIEPATLVPVCLDVALMLSAYAVASSLFKGAGATALSWRDLCAYIASFLIFARVESLYSPFRRKGMAEFSAAGRSTLAASALTAIARQHLSVLSAVELFTFCAVSVFLLVTRMWLERTLFAETRSRHVLIIGNGSRSQGIASAMRLDRESGRVVKGFMAENHLRNIYGSAMLGRIAREEFIDEIVIASTDPMVAQAAIEEARRNLLDVRFAPEVPSSVSRAQIENAGGVLLLRMRDHRLPEYSLAMKRLLDVCASALGLIVLAPLFAAIAALIKLDTPGPVLYRGMRIGRKKQNFSCYKFRTMVQDADAIKDELRSRNEREGAFFKLRKDPRVTRIGSFLRRYSLDELPQLWNVLVGDMSLVGPRPHPADDVSRYTIHHMQRLDFVPGITGLWQVTARKDPSFERSVALDVDYIKRWSLWLDLQILWRTIFVVLEGSGV